MLKIVSIAGYIGMLAGLVGLLATGNLFSASPFVIIVQALALLLFVWARVTFGRRSYHAMANPTEGGLVTNGPYRYIRHPIYASFSAFTLAGAVAHWSWISGLFGGLILGCAMMRMFREEALVGIRYPEYSQYKAATWRMIPYVY
jgi:protein-S-isoprenylcysteine O-methyltransferase Ste14